MGAFIGAYSHVSIDGIMHGDVLPFAPFSEARPWLGVMPVETLQWLCVAAGAVAVAALAWRRWRTLPR